MLFSIFTTSLLTLQAPVQDPAPGGGQVPVPEAATTEASQAPRVTPGELRDRIHEMRMNLLLGGERVREAEGEAVHFYRSKITTIEERVDSIHVELAEKRASYDLALDRSLSGSDAVARSNAMSQASALRT